MQIISYIEELSLIYSFSSKSLNNDIRNSKVSNQEISYAKGRTDPYLTRFYQIYLQQQQHQLSAQSHQQFEMALLNRDDSSSSSMSSSVSTTNVPPLITVLHPRCPLECYLRLVFSRVGHELGLVFEYSIDLIQTVIAANKKNSDLQQLAYLVGFDWLENFLASIVNEKFKKNNNIINEFRLSKQNNLNKLSTLLLTIFISNASFGSLIDKYCSRIYARLKRFINYSNLIEKQLNSNSFNNPSNQDMPYFYLKKSAQLRQNLIEKRILYQESSRLYINLWIETLVSSVRAWHKYKNIVKVIDFLICYSFDKQNLERMQATNNSIIDSSLLDEIYSIVCIDFGITPANMSTNAANELSISNNLVTGAIPLSNQSLSSSSSSYWLQPSISWLSNSFSYVVTATASQLSDTMGAAFDAVSSVSGSNSSNSNGDFDSNQHQQFTYDKRLYKECPYVGLYLSLCEERIEAQLGLWNIFRSYLLGGSGDLIGAVSEPIVSSNNASINTPAFIESCWRKTLQTVNKLNNLTLNFSPQRLMLFKWCERALELNSSHPLLIIYWQKFFNIYLDKQHCSNTFSITVPCSSINPQSSAISNGIAQFDLEMGLANNISNNSNNNNDTSSFNLNIQSPTLKLFTSTPQLSSLLKRIKKQLELTSEHYAYECHNQTLSTNQQQLVNSVAIDTTFATPSAPISNYNYNELMSKLYYSLSLWVDETRLHDPTLYLPALPSHYEPNLLAKIFNNQFELWIYYVDENKLRTHIASIVKGNCKAIETQQLSTQTNDSSSSTMLFFKYNDRMVLSMPKLTDNDMNFQNPLKERFGDSIESLIRFDCFTKASSSEMREKYELILNLCKHLVSNIFRYNKDMINHVLNHMLKLDEKLCNKLLQNLWHNETCEKYVQVPCTSLINPMHQCTRPAMIKFVYEIATKRDQLRYDIKENRANYDKCLSNLIEMPPKNGDSTPTNKFPRDDVIKSMVALNQLIKRLLRSHNLQQQQQQQQIETENQKLLTSLFYLLIDSYETQMNNPNDLLNTINKDQSFANYMNPLQPFESLSAIDYEQQPHQQLQQFSSDSIHLYIFDLIHLIGKNFIQSKISKINDSNRTTNDLNKNNQQILLEKLLSKLVSNVSLEVANFSNNSNNISSSSSTRRNTYALLNLTYNQLNLMSLCAQYVEPFDVYFFNESYTKILCSITSILINNNLNSSSSLTTDKTTSDVSLLSNYNSVEILNQKFSVVLQLLSSFSFAQLNRLLEQIKNKDEKVNICKKFVEINLNFLSDLKFEKLENNRANHHQQQFVETNLRSIIHQCIDNLTSILNVDYPLYFEYMLKKLFEFSSMPTSLKYGIRHLTQFNTILQQHEFLLMLYNDKSSSIESRLLSKEKFDLVFKYLVEFFAFERNKFKSQRRSFYSHWCLFTRSISTLYSHFFSIYIDRYVIKDCLMLLNETGVHEELSQTKIESDRLNLIMKKFEIIYDKLWLTLIDIYMAWIEPCSVKEVTSQTLINVSEIYETQVALVPGYNEELLNSTPSAAVLIMIDSFMRLFNSLLERMNMLSMSSSKANSNLSLSFSQNAKNYALNKFFHFYYESIACSLNSSSIVNDNTLDCYNRCLSKYAPSWFGGGLFEPDYRSVNIMSELCTANNVKLVRMLAFDVVAHLDLGKICDSFFRRLEVTPMQINDMLKCWLQMLAEFCLREGVREASGSLFDSLLRPIYNQAEVLQCWSMLSDTSYSDVIMQRFCIVADQRYAFASRGTDRGLLMSLLKSAAEFYSLTERNSLSCFASAKRRAYLRAICEILLKPPAANIKADFDSFQTCIINLLTDIETFAMSAAAATVATVASLNNDELKVSDAANNSIRHEIQLLIDECLNLVCSQANPAASNIYMSIFSSWLDSSKDSPILLHFINRISRSYNLLIASGSSCERYCFLLELCLEVYFQTDRLNHHSNSQKESILEVTLKELNKLSLGWQMVMDDIDFKLNTNNNNTSISDSSEKDIFEVKCIQNSCYLLLSAYMSQRYAVFRASSTNNLEFFGTLLKYIEQIFHYFFNNASSSTTDSASPSPIKTRPKPGKEEKFIILLNKLLEFYLSMMHNCNSSLIQSKIGEQLMRLSALLLYYGEDTLSSQNPVNDSIQSLGSDLLASIGLNILAKRSPYSIEFRFFSRCMAICILKQIVIVNEPADNVRPSKESLLAVSSNALFPKLQEPSLSIETDDSFTNYLYKIRMSHNDTIMIGSNELGSQNDPNLKRLHISPKASTSSSPPKDVSSHFSTSLPNTSSNPIFNSYSHQPSKVSSILAKFNQQFKQAAYQFHLLFQNKAYASQPILIELANYVNQNLQAPAQAPYFCLPQVYNMSKHICAKLYKEKYYLF
jgi:hypothetical protein